MTSTNIDMMNMNVYVYQKAGEVVVATEHPNVAVPDPWELVARLIEVIIQTEQVTNEAFTDREGSAS